VEKTGSCTQSAADEALDTTLSLSLGPPVAKGEGECKGTPQTSNFSVAAPVVEALELAAPAEELSGDTGAPRPRAIPLRRQAPRVARGAPAGPQRGAIH